MSALIPTPEVVLGNLSTVDGLLANLPAKVRDNDVDPGAIIEELEQARRMVRAAGQAIKILTELTVDPESGRLRPKDAGQIWYIVDLIIAAKMVPRGYEIDAKNRNYAPDPSKVFLGVAKALEVGVEPITGIANIMIVNNRATVWGDLAQALVQRSGLLEWQKHEKIGTPPEPGLEPKNWPVDYGYRVISKRKGQPDPYVGEFTVANAKQAGLWMNTDKQPWITDPDGMLLNRARAKSQRHGFADGLYGFAIAEEQDDIIVTGQQIEAGPTVDNLADEEPEEAPKAPELVDYSERVEPKFEGSAESVPVEAEAGGQPESTGAETDQPTLTLERDERRDQ